MGDLRRGTLVLLLLGGILVPKFAEGQPNHWPRPRQPAPYDAESDPWNVPQEEPTAPTGEPHATPLGAQPVLHNNLHPGAHGMVMQPGAQPGTQPLLQQGAYAGAHGVVMQPGAQPGTPPLLHQEAHGAMLQPGGEQDVARLEAQLRRDEEMYLEVGRSLRNRQELLDRHRAARIGHPGSEGTQTGHPGDPCLHSPWAQHSTREPPRAPPPPTMGPAPRPKPQRTWE
jgi:hypothetical protein